MFAELLNINTSMFRFTFDYKGFRFWVTRKWYEHKREKLSWECKPVTYSQQEWFNKNKWFLKKLYKETV